MSPQIQSTYIIHIIRQMNVVVLPLNENAGRLQSQHENKKTRNVPHNK